MERTCKCCSFWSNLPAIMPVFITSISRSCVCLCVCVCVLLCVCGGGGREKGKTEKIGKRSHFQLSKVFIA